MEKQTMRNQVIIEGRSIVKSFGTLPVLRGADLQAHRGDIVGIIGPSGGGKSTFLRCLNFLETPDQGSVYFQGQEIDSHSREQVRAHRARVSMVFQQFNLWSHLSVLENVTLAPRHVLGLKKQEADEKARSLLQRVGLFEKKDAHPAQLSGGQQQRVAIARALAMDPDVILLDEPTSSLDPELVGEVVKVIRSLALEGRTMILVSHEMRLIRDISTNVLFMDQGKVAFAGPPAEVFGGGDARLNRFLAHFTQDSSSERT